MRTTTRCRVCGKEIPPNIPEQAVCTGCRYDDPEPAKPWNTIPDPFPNNPDAITYHPTWEPEPPRGNPERDRLTEALRRFLELLAGDNPPLLTGQMAHVLAFLIGVSQHRTQRELAEALKISPGRLSQILGQIPSEFASLSRLKHRSRYTSRNG